jgi:hypothetical protein
MHHGAIILKNLEKKDFYKKNVRKTKEVMSLHSFLETKNNLIKNFNNQRGVVFMEE